MNKEQIEEDIKKLEALFNHEGFEVFMRLIGGLVEREQTVLRTQKLDHSYYQRIGFGRAIKYLSELKEVVKDKKVREFLITQGYAMGFDYAAKFVKQEMATKKNILNQAKDTEISQEEKLRFFEQNKV